MRVVFPMKTKVFLFLVEHTEKNTQYSAGSVKNKEKKRNIHDNKDKPEDKNFIR